MGANDIKKTSCNSDKYVNYLKSFDFISVREMNAVSQITSLSGRNDIQLQIDPTLFLTREEWANSIDIGERMIKEDYIFYYAFTYSKEVNKIVQSISAKYNLPVYIMDVKNWGPKGLRKLGFNLSSEFGPSAFINLIKYSKLVFTTSFHGTVFSVIFGINFWYVDSSMHNSKDDRAVSLLSQLGLPDRLQNGNYLLSHDVMVKWNVQDVYKRIKLLQCDAEKFLLNSIK